MGDKIKACFLIIVGFSMLLFFEAPKANTMGGYKFEIVCIGVFYVAIILGMIFRISDELLRDNVIIAIAILMTFFSMPYILDLPAAISGNTITIEGKIQDVYSHTRIYTTSGIYDNTLGYSYIARFGLDEYYVKINGITLKAGSVDGINGRQTYKIEYLKNTKKIVKIQSLN